MTFVHLHCHSHYSLLDGLPKPKAYIQKAKTYGAPALAMTDHGNLYGAIEFYKEAKEADLKPIIGIEAYTAATSRFSKQTGIDNAIGHLILLAKNKTGYENLMSLSTKAHLEGFYYKPRIDLELLKEHSEGLILLTGCLNGDIPKALLNSNWEKATELLKTYQTMLGKENVFLELQDHPYIMEQGILNERLIQLASRNRAPLVATNDCHCLEKEDKEAHDVLLCIQTGAKVHQEDRFRMEGEFYMRSPEEMTNSFKEIPEAIQNTLEIAQMCDLKLSLGKNLLPSFDTPFQKTTTDYLKELCEDGMKKRYGENPEETVTQRLHYELGVIRDMGFETYFLIVHDFVAFAKNSGIVVGPGRGSAAGSIVAYCLEITDIDPLKYNLIFERFLNPERVSMPDIDIDFADDRRDEVLNYVTQKYGKTHVAQIITFGTMAARAAVRDVGRALGLPYSEVDTIAKLIPARPGIKLTDAIEQETELRRNYEANANVKKLLDLALKLEGVVRHASVHACAVVISEEPLIHHTPLQYAPGGQETVITQYSMHDIEAIGLLKMDFLGLKNLTILDYALKIIQRTKNKEIDLDQLPLDDKKTFELMARGETTGVFQFESPGMRRYLKALKPTRLEDLIAMNALYRPGPMDWIPSYIEGKHNANQIKYLDPSFKPILEETYGVAVYQEQILQLAQLVANFSLGEADILRKAVGKKIPKLLAEQRSKFIKGAIEKGHNEAFAKKVFEKVIEPFAGYGFNKAHATCYAMIAYRTAYLKSHYPAEFMAALMTSDQDNSDRIAIEINESEAMGIQVLPPSINESMAHFTVVEGKQIRFGLAAIKGLGLATAREILELRDKTGPFKSIDDLIKRVPHHLLNKKTLEALAYAGALDELGERRSIVNAVDEISRHARNLQVHSSHGQIDIFSMLEETNETIPRFELPKVPPASPIQKLTWEKQVLGLYVSGHPLQGLTAYLKKKADLISSLTRKRTGHTIKCAGILIQVKKIVTKSGGTMAYATLEDPTGRIEVTCFPNVFNTYRELLNPESVVVITGKVEFRKGELQLMCQTVQAVSLEAMIERAKQNKLYNPEERIQIRSKPKEEENIQEPNTGSTEENAPPTAPPMDSENPTEHKLVIALENEKASPEHLQKIKEVLLAHQGELEVEIHIPQGISMKRIKVPFGVDLNEELRKKLKEVNSL